jgi:hypothetical protein
VHTEAHYVPVPDDRYRRAAEWAFAHIARRQPGAAATAEHLQSLIAQKLAADTPTGAQ